MVISDQHCDLTSGAAGRIAHLDAGYAAAPEHCFGAEARAAFRLTLAEELDVPFHRFMLRPPLEPIVFSYWDRFRARAFTVDAATDLVSALVGAPTAPRTGQAMARSNAGSQLYWAYPTPDHAKGWLKRLYAIDPKAFAPLDYAAFCLAEVVTSHPYPNGNGRLGRAFFHGALAHTVGLSCPFLPLGPAMYASAEELTASLRNLSTGAGRKGYLTTIASVVNDAVRLCDPPPAFPYE